jgi:hypothetical protein
LALKTGCDTGSSVLVPALAAFADAPPIVAVELDLEFTDTKLLPAIDSRE